MTQQLAEEVAEDVRAAQRLGVRTTPTFFVNGAYFKGPQSYADLTAFIDRELGRKPREAEHPATETALDEVVRGLAAAELGDALPPVPREILPPPDAIFNLRRAALAPALRERAQLEARLGFAPGSHDGRRLLKLVKVEPGDAFDQLALQTDDVLLMVDGEWVTDAGNPLWRALEDRSEITLVLLRGTRRQIFRYVVE